MSATANYLFGAASHGLCTEEPLRYRCKIRRHTYWSHKLQLTQLGEKLACQFVKRHVWVRTVQLKQDMMVATSPTKQTLICTFGLAGGYVGRRNSRFHEVDGASLHDRRALLHDHIRALWHDYAGDYIQIHPIDFTDREDQCEHFVVELMQPLNREADAPVLWIDKGFQEDNELRVGKTACYVPRRSHVQQVIHHAGRQHVCTSLVQGQCILKYKHRLLLPDDDVGVDAGGFFECLYDVDDTNDHIMLLQTAGSSPLSAWEKGREQGDVDTLCLQDAVDLPTDFYAERLDYDPDVASVRHYYEGTGQAPPSRTFFGRQLSQEWIAAHQEPPDGGLWVQTYGLHYDSVGNRKRRVEYATIDSLMEAMQDLWPEYMDFDQRAYAVNPQPDPIDSNVFHACIDRVYGTWWVGTTRSCPGCSRLDGLDRGWWESP